MLERCFIHVTVTLRMFVTDLLVELLLQAEYLLSQRIVVFHLTRAVMDRHLAHQRHAAGLGVGAFHVRHLVP